MFAVITENDESQWDDHTGKSYHFPKQYLNFLKPGTKVIYYKGKMINRKYSDKRLSKEPHYFGKAIIGDVYNEQGTKNYRAIIENCELFSKAVPNKINDNYLEPIPKGRESNYWRNGVRPINENVFNRIVNHEYISYIHLHDQQEDEFVSSREEGGQKLIYTTVYERDKVSRDLAISIHGYACMVCHFNFRNFYGTCGEGFIHVHHITPLSIAKKRGKVNPKTDMIVVCPNCHAMIHRRKDKILTLEELQNNIKEAKGSR
jgi:5-methylcytosine-specific restriction enzyme A